MKSSCLSQDPVQQAQQGKAGGTQQAQHQGVGQVDPKAQPQGGAKPSQGGQQDQPCAGAFLSYSLVF